MSSYTEIDTALLDLDFTNPRIQNYLQNYPEESRSGELLAMLLGTGTDSCASLKESIKEHGGIINPIIVNHFPDMYLFQIVLRELIKSLDQNETFC